MPIRIHVCLSVCSLQVIHDVYGKILEVNRTGSNKHLWHSAEIMLPYDLGIIENPIFAVYPGGNWENQSFQKTAVRFCLHAIYTPPVLVNRIFTGFCTGECYEPLNKAPPPFVEKLIQMLSTLRQDCEKRTLQGDAGLWNSCDTTVRSAMFDTPLHLP